MLGSQGRQRWQTVSQTRREGYRPSQPNTRTKAAREDVDSGALDIGPFGRDGEQALKIVQARGEKRALIERDAAFAAHLLPSTHLPTSRSPAAELDPPPSSSRRSPPLIGPMSPAR
ncbi:hypothetical protein HBI56_169880 [Parastagonospora nodorum]|nr:hypothetical protein HBI10_144520 [Parastagonospora nodorum]KAH4021201.1 hypothetical protein HBI13_112820 [Parastagonospora nodorum]KAH4107633.1 hypothetical protein HBH46_055540 [Parastagonospora nodorum]KAH4140285.1 hypothetical protein HBH45_088400 [Parastagonospora nodorum]KAH4205158.1 hypothetical protein HBI95_144500 [Parastagonospora nodorum]